MSVRKRRWPDPYTGPNEGWVADYIDGRGKRRRKSFARKKDAEQFLLTAKSEVRDGVHTADAETVTVGVAGDLWIKSGDASGLERTTIDQRRQHLELHIKPMLGTMRLNRLSLPVIRDFHDRLREAGRSPGMVKRVTVSLGSILGDAQDRGLTVRNPVREASRTRSARNGSQSRARKRLAVGVDLPTTQELKRLLDHAIGRYRPLLMTMAFAGLRASEARGLQWSDVDLLKGTLQVSQRADRYREIGAPKSHAGIRSIPLPPIVVNTLKEWKLACPKGELGLVFPNTEGGVDFHQNMVHRGMWPAEIAAGLTVDTGKVDEDGKAILAPKYPGFHALRHWFASWLINRKVDGGLELPAKTVQTRMGHSSIQITFDTYGHLFPVADEQAELKAAERAIFGPHGT
ncbi:MAG: tyrosine-type recombinase/integrase [Devosia sp.]